MKYTVPVICTIVGWTEIEASSIKEAKKKAQAMNDGDGVPMGDIKDSDTVTECLLDEIEPEEQDDD
jgi:hypothetical protein